MTLNFSPLEILLVALISIGVCLWTKYRKRVRREWRKRRRGLRIFGHHHTTIRCWLRRGGQYSARLHERLLFRVVVVGHLQLDELVTRVKRETERIWVWTAVAAKVPAGVHERWTQPVLLWADRAFRVLARAAKSSPHGSPSIIPQSYGTTVSWGGPLTHS